MKNLEISGNKYWKYLALLEKMRVRQRYLENKIGKAHEWGPVVPYFSKEKSFTDVLHDYHQQYAELKELEIQLLKSFPIVKRRHYGAGPMDLPKWREGKAGVMEGPEKLEGVLRPTNFKEIRWCPPEEGYSEKRNIHSKLLRRGTVDERTVGDYWVEVDDLREVDAVGFSAHLESKESWDTMGVILCLEYRLPFLPQCDSVLAWNMNATGAFPSGLKLYGDEGTSACLDAVYHEQPESHGIPELEQFSWLNNSMIDKPTESWVDSQWQMNGWFKVREGVQPAIWVGVAIQFRTFDWGVFNGAKLIDSKVSIPHVCSRDCIMSNQGRLWEEGVFHVNHGEHADLWGISYEMVPTS